MRRWHGDTHGRTDEAMIADDKVERERYGHALHDSQDLGSTAKKMSDRIQGCTGQEDEEHLS